MKIFNRGISGNKVYQLAERWQADCLDLKPNVLSILIGVNDFWHSSTATTTARVEKYETDYRALLKRTKDALPEMKLMICEPFVLKVGAVDDSWFPGFRRLSRGGPSRGGRCEGDLRAVPDDVRRGGEDRPAGHWAGDGVHPATGSGADGALVDEGRGRVASELDRRGVRGFLRGSSFKIDFSNDSWPTMKLWWSIGDFKKRTCGASCALRERDY